MSTELHALAAAGGRTFTDAEAERVGIDLAALVRLVRTGVCVRLRRGLYALAVDVPKWPDERHTLLAIGVARQYASQIALSHHSALIAADVPTWGVPYDRVRAVRVAGSHRGTRSGLTVGDAWPDDAYDSVEPRLIPAVACLQIATAYGVEQAVVSLDAALARGLTSTDELAIWLGRLRGHRNVERARRAVALANHLSESPGESRLRVRLHHLGYVDLEPQVWIKVNGRVLGRVDLLDRAHRVVIEFDGKVKHQGDKGSEAVVREKVREDGVVDSALHGTSGMSWIPTTCSDGTLNGHAQRCRAPKAPEARVDPARPIPLDPCQTDSTATSATRTIGGVTSWVRTSPTMPVL